jgi:ribosomal protein S8
MNHSFNQSLSLYKNAVTNNKKILLLRFSKNTEQFCRFLCENGFISSYTLLGTKNYKYIKIFLKYNNFFNPALLNFSIVSKAAHGRSFQKQDFVKKKNALFVNYTVGTKQKTKLLARFL